MTRLSRYFGRKTFHWITIALLATLGASQVVRASQIPPTRPAPGHKPHSEATTQKTARTPSTPFDRVIRPGLEKMLAQAKSQGQHFAMSGLGVQTSDSSALPFAGFVAAPTFPAWDAADKDNSGLV